jgi:hypothetical protein
MNPSAGVLRAQTSEIQGFGDSKKACGASRRPGVRFGGDEEPGSFLDETEARDGIEEVLPALIAIEVPCVDAEPGVRREVECGTGLVFRRTVDRRGPRDGNVARVREQIGE